MIRTSLLITFMFIILAALSAYIIFLTHKSRSILMQNDQLKTTLTSKEIQDINSNTNTVFAAVIAAWVLVGLIGVGTLVDYAKSSSGSFSFEPIAADVNNP